MPNAEDEEVRKLAANIFAVWVQEPPLPQISLSFATEHDSKAYQRKILIYRIASVLMMLASIGSRGGLFLSLQECFELLVFGAEPTPNAMERFNEVKTAMKDLSLLINDGKELSWAQAWLADLGHEVYNPVDLFALSQAWLGQLASLSEYFRTLDSESN